MNINEIAKNNNLCETDVNILTELVNCVNEGNIRVAIRDISKKCYCSTTSIVRLAKKLGYVGYSDMLYSLKNDNVQSIEYNINDIMRSILLGCDSLDVLDSLIGEIVNNEYYRIHFIGIGYSNIPCMYIHDKLDELDYRVSIKSPLDYNMKEPSIVIFISESGETSDLIFIAKRCKSMNCKLYAITSQSNSNLAKTVKNHIVIKKGRGNITNEKPDYFISNTMTLMESILTIITNMGKRG